jgi:hypothetical protein
MALIRFYDLVKLRLNDVIAEIAVNLRDPLALTQFRCRLDSCCADQLGDCEQRYISADLLHI